MSYLPRKRSIPTRRYCSPQATGLQAPPSSDRPWRDGSREGRTVGADWQATSAAQSRRIDERTPVSCPAICSGCPLVMAGQALDIAATQSPARPGEEYRIAAHLWRRIVPYIGDRTIGPTRVIAATLSGAARRLGATCSGDCGTLCGSSAGCCCGARTARHNASTHIRRAARGRSRHRRPRRRDPPDPWVLVHRRSAQVNQTDTVGRAWRQPSVEIAGVLELRPHNATHRIPSYRQLPRRTSARAVRTRIAISRRDLPVDASLLPTFGVGSGGRVVVFGDARR